MFDTHCHLTFPEYAGRVAQTLQEAAARGVRGAITIATTSEDAAAALALAEAHPTLWCSAGVHPLYSDRTSDLGVIRRIIAHPRCVAWGELGLDRHYADPPPALQQRVLEAQMAMIEETERSDQAIRKPIVLHCRKAYSELIGVLRATRLDPTRMVFHCFTGGPDDMRLILDFGAMVSFTGVVTFKNAREVAEALLLVPMDRLMVETDAPFLTPEPHRTVRPNEPKYVVEVARRLAALRGIDDAGFAEFERLLDANARRFFGITLP